MLITGIVITVINTYPAPGTMWSTLCPRVFSVISPATLGGRYLLRSLFYSEETEAETVLGQCVSHFSVHMSTAEVLLHSGVFRSSRSGASGGGGEGGGGAVQV